MSARDELCKSHEMPFSSTQGCVGLSLSCSRWFSCCVFHTGVSVFSPPFFTFILCDFCCPALSPVLFPLATQNPRHLGMLYAWDVLLSLSTHATRKFAKFAILIPKHFPEVTRVKKQVRKEPFIGAWNFTHIVMKNALLSVEPIQPRNFSQRKQSFERSIEVLVGNDILSQIHLVKVLANKNMPFI